MATTGDTDKEAVTVGESSHATICVLMALSLSMAMVTNSPKSSVGINTSNYLITPSCCNLSRATSTALEALLNS